MKLKGIFKQTENKNKNNKNVYTKQQVGIHERVHENKFRLFFFVERIKAAAVASSAMGFGI